MLLDLVPTADLATRAAPYNPRRISAKELDKLGRSMRTFGVVEPVVINKRSGNIVGGHQRVKAAQREKIERLPVYLVDLDDTQERQLNLALNKISGEWDDAALGALIAELNDKDADLGLAGFDDNEIAKTLRRFSRVDAGAQIDRADELQKVWDVERGQLWQIGRHKLLCGDATNATDVSRLFLDSAPQLMVTDPPYGTNYDPTWRMRARLHGPTKKMGKLANDGRVDWLEAWALFPGDVAYVFHAGIHTSTVQDSLESAGFEIRAQIIWAKDRIPLSRGDYHWQHESCWYAVRSGRAAKRTDDRTQTTLWQIPARGDNGHGHGTQKPVECMARPIRNHEFGVVYDPFAGSGTTFVAAEQLGRCCLGIEIEPKYVAVILQRLQDIGLRPEHGERE